MSTTKKQTSVSGSKTTSLTEVESNSSTPPSFNCRFRVDGVFFRNEKDLLHLVPDDDGDYGPDGQNEANNFARYLPEAKLELLVSNPDLQGKYKTGQIFEAEFTPVRD